MLSQCNVFLQDECSFVSLRDVERAMIVFEYMYSMMDVLGPLVNDWAEKELSRSDQEQQPVISEDVLDQPDGSENEDYYEDYEAEQDYISDTVEDSLFTTYKTVDPSFHQSLAPPISYGELQSSQAFDSLDFYYEGGKDIDVRKKMMRLHIK